MVKPQFRINNKYLRFDKTKEIVITDFLLIVGNVHKLFFV